MQSQLPIIFQQLIHCTSSSMKLQELGDGVVGGIVRYANGIFEYCDTVEYDDMTPEENTWKSMGDVLQ